MTPKELQSEAQSLRSLVGEKAYISVSVETTGDCLQLGIWPNGISNEGTFFVRADEWTSLFAKARTEWERRRETYHAELIERMALEIIATTARTGSCSEAALRVHFTARDIETLGAAAVAKADAMAANGPFSIERSANSNTGVAA